MQGEMQVFAFLRMERLLFKFAKRAATWNEVMHCGGSWTGLLRTFEALPLFQRHPRLLCWIQYQEECRPFVRSVFNLTPQTFCGTCGTGISPSKLWYHYEVWAIMVSSWAMSQEILMLWMQLLYQSSSKILRARCLARRCTLVNNDHRHLSPTATRCRDNYSFSCGHCNYIVIDIAPTEETQLSIST